MGNFVGKYVCNFVGNFVCNFMGILADNFVDNINTISDQYVNIFFPKIFQSFLSKTCTQQLLLMLYSEYFELLVARMSVSEKEQPVKLFRLFIICFNHKTSFEAINDWKYYLIIYSKDKTKDATDKIISSNRFLE